MSILVEIDQPEYLLFTLDLISHTGAEELVVGLGHIRDAVLLGIQDVIPPIVGRATDKYMVGINYRRRLQPPVTAFGGSPGPVLDVP